MENTISNDFECVGAYHDSCNLAQLFEAQLHQYPGMSPGQLTDMRSASVNNDCYA